MVDDKGDAISTLRRKFTAEESTLTMTVGRKPSKAGIDTLNKPIDRRPDDNTVAVTGGYTGVRRRSHGRDCPRR